MSHLAYRYDLPCFSEILFQTPQSHAVTSATIATLTSQAVEI